MCTYGDPFVRSPKDADEASPHHNKVASPLLLRSSPHGPESPYADLEDIDQAWAPDERRLLELRLLHHFTPVVVNSFTTEQFRQLWLQDSVRLGFEHPFLLNAIFAITSLYVVCDAGQPPRVSSKGQKAQAGADAINRPDFSLGNISPARAHRIYLNLAVRTQREAVSSINPENADAVFLASVLLSYQTLKLLPDSPGPNLYSPPTQWLRMSNAIAAVLQVAAPLVREGSVVDMVRTTQMDPDFRDTAAIFDPQNMAPFEALVDWSRYPEPDLEAILNKESPNVLFRRLVSLGILVTAPFATFLDQGRPRALVILAHHFAMAKAAEEHWWMRGVADREVIGIQSVVPADWQWAMEWPLSVLRQGIRVG